MDSVILEYLGYAASVIIAISMTMSSILKFRWINFAGAALFSVYGILIDAWPVAALNFLIVCVDVYYLIGIYAKKEVFEILEVRPENRYLIRFVDFHCREIHKFFPGYEYSPTNNTLSFFTLRNMAVAGVFVAERQEDNALCVHLDYVLPEYRDFKNGRFIYNQVRPRFIEAGFTKILATPGSKKHIQYLRTLGFTSAVDGKFEKTLQL